MEIDTSPYGAYTMHRRARGECSGMMDAKRMGVISPSTSAFLPPSPFLSPSSSSVMHTRPPPSPYSPYPAYSTASSHASSLPPTLPSSSFSPSPALHDGGGRMIPRGNTGELVDIQYIKSHELAHVLQNKHALNIQVVIVDCRYPYEYEGGHIQGSINLFSNEMIHNVFLSAGEGEGEGGAITRHGQEKEVMIVFHCEYSSARGPAGYRYLREHDRRANYTHYPRLSYPNMFLLESGYKEFYPDYKHLCSGGYVEMIDKNYTEELKLCRRVQKGERMRKRALFCDVASKEQR